MIWSLFFLQSNDITYSVWTGPGSGFWERWCSSPAIHLYLYETKFLSILRFLWPISDVFLSIFLIFPQQHLFCHSNQQLINIVRQGRRCLYEFSIQGCCMVFAIYIKKVSSISDLFPSTNRHWTPRSSNHLQEQVITDTKINKYQLFLQIINV